MKQEIDIADPHQTCCVYKPCKPRVGTQDTVGWFPDCKPSIFHLTGDLYDQMIDTCLWSNINPIWPEGHPHTYSTPTTPTPEKSGLTSKRRGI